MCKNNTQLKRLVTAGRENKSETVCGGVENTGTAQMQLGEQICAREYANSSFVRAVDWPPRRASAREGS